MFSCYIVYISPASFGRRLRDKFLCGFRRAPKGFIKNREKLIFINMSQDTKIVVSIR
jgi:hypothetical protein